ncbi:hypothetical protein Zmor_009667 [Zophobas morio]|uniref:Uncharacterized protein n=1 Tax=Zophobas morio TaxID=2755281 RepID=A0AA38MIR4_9CUCU|nr:hypothetical protein Zmor_009667 [Zophobas morio]
MDLLSKGFDSLQFTDVAGAKFIFHHVTTYVFGIYIQLKATVEEYDLLFNLIGNLTELFNQGVVIIREINIPDYNPDLSASAIGNKKLLKEFCNYHQYNNVYNTNGWYLDFVISDFNCITNKSIDSLLTEDPHHPTLYINLSLRVTRLRLFKSKKYHDKQ